MRRKIINAHCIRYGQNVPGFVRLMNVLKPRPKFDVLIMSEESRLGREQIEVPRR